MEALILPERLDTEYATLFSEILKKQPDGFLLDGRNVGKVGGLSFQLLVSAYATAQALGVSFEIRNISREMKEDLVLLGGEFLLKAVGEA